MAAHLYWRRSVIAVSTVSPILTECWSGCSGQPKEHKKLDWKILFLNSMELTNKNKMLLCIVFQSLISEDHEHVAIRGLLVGLWPQFPKFSSPSLSLLPCCLQSLIILCILRLPGSRALATSPFALLQKIRERVPTIPFHDVVGVLVSCMWDTNLGTLVRVHCTTLKKKNGGEHLLMSLQFELRENCNGGCVDLRQWNNELHRILWLW